MTYAQYPCPICAKSAEIFWVGQGLQRASQYRCARCGHFKLEPSVVVGLQTMVARDQIQRSVLSHVVRCAQNDGHVLEVNDRTIQSASEQDPVSPLDQIDNLVRWLGAAQRSASDEVYITAPELAARMRSAIDASEQPLRWLIDQKECQIYLERRVLDEHQDYTLQLNIVGWQLYRDLKRQRSQSYNAFMAMKFGNVILDDIVGNYFKPAVKQAGFDLKTLTDGQAAGLIDNQIRAAIRTAAFVVADLTHENNGAYFEAGFAEGIGLHVIYTCEASKFDEKKTHFDTNHSLTVPWIESKPDVAAEALKATIRASLPGVATMID